MKTSNEHAFDPHALPPIRQCNPSILESSRLESDNSCQFEFSLEQEIINIRERTKSELATFMSKQESLDPHDQEIRYVCLRLCRNYEQVYRYTKTKSYIYFIEAHELNKIKIGFSTNLKRRLCNFRVSSPANLTVRMVFKGGMDIESYLHSVFRKDHSHGEWFYITPRMKKLIEMLDSYMRYEGRNYMAKKLNR